jgi:hypothetical protein
MSLSFDQVLPRLVAAYERGRLVPFIGSGMSLPVARSWKGLITGLEEAAGVPSSAEPEDNKPEALVRRANKATRKLRLVDEAKFYAVVRSLMGDAKSDPPAQSLALARLWWPLVLSTNYDNLYAAAHRRQHSKGSVDGERPIQVLGRSAIDCQHVLSSLSSPSHAILWALQGFLRAPNTTRLGRLDRECAGEVVIGHQEYRAVANRELHFRRAFAEVFRNRSLFFLGSGLSESYLLDLFGEVLEIYGPSTRPNYAFLRRGEVDPEFMLARFHTEVCEYDSYEELPVWLERLADAVEQRACRQVRWSYNVNAPRRGADAAAREDFTVVRGDLRAPADDECLIVSAGERNGQLHFGPEAAAVLRTLGLKSGLRPARLERPLTVVSEKPRVLAAVAVEADRARDLRNVFSTCETIFGEMDRLGVRRVVMQPIYSGKRSLFPDRLALAQIARAFGYWRSVQPASRFEIELHTWKPSIYQELASGRLDLIEMLSSEAIRFWAEIVEPGGAVERRLFHEHPSFEMRALFERIELPARGWTLEVSPAPSPEDVPRPAETCLDDSLIELGVVPGSSIVLRRVASTRSATSGAAPHGST